MASSRSLGPGIREVLGEGSFVEVGTDDGVDLLRPAGGARDLLVRHQAGPTPHALLDEADRLGWLAGRGPAPELIASGRADDGAETVVVRLDAGAVRVDDHPPVAPETLAQLLGSALADLHTIETVGCPFESGLDELCAVAADRVALGAVEPTSSGPYAGRSADSLLEVLRATVAELGPRAAPVVVHGGLRAERVWCRPGGGLVVTGWRRAGIGDAHLDLAAAAQLVHDLHGPALVSVLVDAYGHDRVDARRLDAHQLLVHLLG